MKTRILKTTFWEDMASKDLSKDTRLLFAYLLTNPRINMCGIFELSDKYIILETGFTQTELQKAKAQLEEIKKVYFYNGWVKIVNAEKHNNYKSSPKNGKTYAKELASIPVVVKEYFDSGSDSSITTTSDTNHKSKIKNKKSEIGVVKGEEKKYPLSYLSDIPEKDLEEFVEKFICNKLQVKSKAHAVIDWCKSEGKKKKNYKSTLSNWLRKDYGERPPKPKQLNSQEMLTDVSKEKASEYIAKIKQSIKIKTFQS